MYLNTFSEQSFSQLLEQLAEAFKTMPTVVKQTQLLGTLVVVVILIVRSSFYSPT